MKLFSNFFFLSNNGLDSGNILSNFFDSARVIQLICCVLESQMKTSKYLEELNTQSAADLKMQLVEAKKELFNLRFQNATNQLDNTSRIKEEERTLQEFRRSLLRKKKLRSRIPERRIVSRGRKKS